MIEIIRDIIKNPDLFQVRNYLQQNKQIIGVTRDRD